MSTYATMLKRIENKEIEPMKLFYDWFCRDTSLNKKSENMIKKVNYILKTLNIDPKNVKVHFANRCPVYGDLYDEIYIDMGDKRFVIAPRLGFEHHHYKECEITFVDPAKENPQESLFFPNYMEFKKQLKGALGERIKAFYAL